RCMSSVYKDPEWSSNINRETILLRPGVELKKAVDWLCERMDDEDFSLSDVWGALTSAEFIKEWTSGQTDNTSGIFGSALASGEVIKEYILNWLKGILPFMNAAEEHQKVVAVLHEVIAVTRNPTVITPVVFDLGTLQRTPEVTKANHTLNLWMDAKSPEERKLLGEQWSLEMLAAVETWTQSQQKGGFIDKVKLVRKILWLIWRWEWGTTENFLYQQDCIVPAYLDSNERFHLMDAGLLMNVPYPPFLGDKRDIDLIIAPDYSAGDVFETLTLARDYAAEVKKPFPEIDDKILKEKDWPKDCYVFEGKEKEPTIVYMPLFNRRNCKDAEEVKAKMDEFSTFQRPYSKEKIEFLLETVKANVKNNKETLLKEINTAVRGEKKCMSSVYKDPEWSSNINRETILLRPGVEWQKAVDWLCERMDDEDFSLSDVWGALTSVYFIKEMDQRHLSDEARRNAFNPYPIYNAINKDCFTDGPIEGKWFEFSPHEAGFTELGFFIETSLVGSKFKGGKLVEKKPEMDMVKLEGIFGSALASGKVIKEYILNWLKGILPFATANPADEHQKVVAVLHEVIAVTRNPTVIPPVVFDLGTLQKTPEVTKANHTLNLWMDAKSPEERNRLAKQWSLEMLAAVETWTQSQQKGGFIDIVKLVGKTLWLILWWEWGTTENFLYQEGGTVPAYLDSNERFHLMDAGLLMNVPYPPFLGDKREIDLIIAPDYSAGDVFETLTLARKYAAEVKKPFPEIDDKILKEKDWPKDCYVFEGKEKEPTIVYMPLFNRRNCKDAAEVKAKMGEFSTFQRPYNKEKIEFLLNTVKANVKNNKETLLKEINKAVHRREKKQSRDGCQRSETMLKQCQSCRCF
ncbi:Cytosolic phospholipase A2 gamma, partial [Nibea albiflora]